MGRQNGLGYTRLTVSDDVNLKNKPITIMVGGKRLDEILEEMEAVINKGAERVLAEDIEALTDAQCDALRCGDMVIFSNRSGEQWCYYVAYKSEKDGEMSLVHSDSTSVEEVVYDKSVNDSWGYKETKTGALVNK